MKFGDIEDAYLYVSGVDYGDNSAMLCRTTGQICYRSEMAGEDEIPEEAYGADDWVEIPHKNDLDLGRALVFAFVTEQMPADERLVRDFFGRRGAYARFKDLLVERDKLQAWYDYHAAREDEALRRWCRDNDIEITD